MAVFQDRYCSKCGKKVRMIRCETCKGTGGGALLAVPQGLQPARLAGEFPSTQRGGKDNGDGQELRRMSEAYVG